MRKLIASLLTLIMLTTTLASLPINAQAKQTYNISVSANGSHFSVSAKKHKSATSYKLYRSSSKNGKYKLVASSNKPLLTDKKSNTKNSYWYQLKGYKKGKTKVTSNKKKALGSKYTPKLRYVCDYNNGNAHLIVWNKVKTADKYYVYRSTYDGNYKRIGTTKKLNFVDRKFDTTRLYFYRVKAIVNGQVSQFSNYQFGTVNKLQPRYKWQYNSKDVSIKINEYIRNAEYVKDYNTNKMVYFVAEVKAPASKIKTAFAGGSYKNCRYQREKACQMLRENKGVFAINGVFCGYSDWTYGLEQCKFSNGKPLYDYNYRKFTDNQEIGYMNKYGKFGILDSSKYKTNAQVSKALSPIETWSFNATYIRNGVSRKFYDKYRAPRTAIGQRADGTWIFVIVDGRGHNNSIGANYSEMVKIMSEQKCINAIELDGGGSSEMCFGDSYINDPSDGGERPLSDIIYVKF